MTVGEWLDIWQKDYLGGVKPFTVQTYSKSVRVHIKPALGAIKLEALTVHRVQGFINDLGKIHGEKKGLSPKTVKCIHGILHKALQQAVVVGYLRFNPADNCALPRSTRKEIKPLDSEDISHFLKAIQGNPFEDVFLVTLFTGMRKGEVLGLTWDCVDLERGHILINKQLQNIPSKPGEYHLVPTKNSKGRMITAAPSVVEVLKRHRTKQSEARLRVGRLWEDSGLVFTDDLGHHLAPSTMYHHYKKIVASIGLPSARFRDLRHSYAVAAIRTGDDIKTV